MRSAAEGATANKCSKSTIARRHDGRSLQRRQHCPAAGFFICRLTIYPPPHYKALTEPIKDDPQAAAARLYIRHPRHPLHMIFTQRSRQPRRRRHNPHAIRRRSGRTRRRARDPRQLQTHGQRRQYQTETAYCLTAGRSRARPCYYIARVRSAAEGATANRCSKSTIARRHDGRSLQRRQHCPAAGFFICRRQFTRRRIISRSQGK